MDFLEKMEKKSFLSYEFQYFSLVYENHFWMKNNKLTLFKGLGFSKGLIHNIGLRLWNERFLSLDLKD